MTVLGRSRSKKCNLCKKRDREPGKTVCAWCLKYKMPKAGT